jgi:hypothetical protein
VFWSLSDQTVLSVSWVCPYSTTTLLVMVSYRNSQFHLLQILMTFFTCLRCIFPFDTYPVCHDRTTWFPEPQWISNPFHSGDRDRGLGIPFLIHSPNFWWVSPFHHVTDSSLTGVIIHHWSRSMRIHPTTMAPHIQHSHSLSTLVAVYGDENSRSSLTQLLTSLSCPGLAPNESSTPASIHSVLQDLPSLFPRRIRSWLAVIRLE